MSGIKKRIQTIAAGSMKYTGIDWRKRQGTNNGGQGSSSPRGRGGVASSRMSQNRTGGRSMTSPGPGPVRTPLSM